MANREALTATYAGKEWRCELQARPDRYGRRVGTCFVAGADIQAWLVRQGHALDWPRYSHGRYAADQEAARAARRGLWSGRFVAPWNWRHRRCATTILGAYSVPIDAREKLCKPPPKHPRKRRM